MDSILKTCPRCKQVKPLTLFKKNSRCPSGRDSSCLACHNAASRLYKQRQREKRPPRPTAAERFWAKVEKTETCWLWRGARDRLGYGSFGAYPGQSPSRAYRYAYELLRGPIPEGLELDHLCRNPARTD